MQDVPEHGSRSSSLSADPISFLSLEADRLRQMCRALDRLVKDNVLNVPAIAAMLESLRIDLVFYYRDESEDLFPLMRLRARRGDDIKRVMALLCEDHAINRDELAYILGQLDRLRRTGPSSEDAELITAVSAFSIQIQKHLALLVAVMLPIARLRLTPADFETLLSGFASRRQSP